MDKKEKQKEISRNLPLFWNSYQHMYDVRVSMFQSSRNFLLVVISFMLVISISLFFRLGNIFLLVPPIIQLIALVILFKTFFIKSMVHWFEYDSTLKDIEKKKFDMDLFATLKTVENWTHKYQKETTKIMENALLLIIFSLYLIFIILAEMYFTFPLKYLIYLILIISLLILWGYYKKQPEYNYEKEHKNFVEKNNTWLKI